MKHVTFNCPKCGEPVEAKADYIARGLKCPACQTGFSPVPVKERPTRTGGVNDSAWRFAAGAVGVVLLVGFGFISFWPAVALAVVVLLAVIAWRLKVIADKR